MQPAFHRLVLARPELKDGWWSSHGPGHADIGPVDLLIVGRVGVREVAMCALAKHKGALGVVLACGLTVVTTHLTSDHTKGGPQHRRDQLARIRSALDLVDGPWVLLGDFNMGDEAPILDTTDAWTAVRAAEPTFDPVNNPLAAIATLTGRAWRLDRVLLHGPLQPVAAEQIGVGPVDGHHPSDHHGVLADLRLQADARVHTFTPTPRFALAWVPASPDLESLTALRVDLAPKGSRRWPPHVNLLWGFVPEHELETATAALGAAAELAPFDTVLDRVGTFRNRRVTHHVAPSDPEPWVRLQRQLRRFFPVPDARDYAPHLTVAEEGDPPELRPLHVEVGELRVLTRRGTGPFRARLHLHLGTGLVQRLPEASWPPGDAEEAPFLDELDARASLVGSRRMGCALDGADVDLLWNGTRDEALEALGHPSARDVVKGGLAGLSLRLRGLPVDIALVPDADDSEAAVLARTAVADADALLDTPRRGALVALCRVVKAWARAQVLDVAAFGGLEGLAWVVLCRETLDAVETDDLDALVRAFFAQHASKTWDTVEVRTPTPPVRNITERAVAWRLEAALLDAWEALDGGAPVEALYVLPRWHAAHVEAVVVRGEDAEARGALRGRIRALVAALDPVVPHPLDDGVALGLARGFDPQVVDEAVAAWVRGMHGVRADRMATELVDDRRVPTRAGPG